MASRVIAMATTASEKKTSRSTDRFSYSGSSLGTRRSSLTSGRPRERARPVPSARGRVVDLGKAERLAGGLRGDEQQVRTVEGDVDGPPWCQARRRGDADRGGGGADRPPLGHLER